MYPAKLIINDKLNITEKDKRYWKLQRKSNHLGSTMLQAKGLTYWTYRGTTSEHFPKHHYDIELAKHFHESNSINDNLNVTTLQSNVKTAAVQRYHEGKWICKLKKLAPDSLNTDVGDYAKEMCYFY